MHPVSKSQQKHYSNGGPRTARHWEESYDNQKLANGEWVKLDGETVSPMPNSVAEGSERGRSDQQALSDAVAGVGTADRANIKKVWKK